MRVDAEKDGVARLASDHDDRITPVGRVIRAIRFDSFPNLISPSAYISPYAKLGWGCVILNNAVVQNGSTAGNGVLINPGVEIHHDASVGDCKATERLVLYQSFRTASKHFFVIEDRTKPVLVPWGAGAEIIAALKERHGMCEEIQLLRRAQAYTVNLYEDSFLRLREKGAIECIGDGSVYVLQEGLYSEETGMADV